MTRTSLISSRSPASGMRSHARGFSLIELLIAMVLGLLVVAGLINLFIANRKAYQVQAGNNFLQENLRIASDRMGWSLRMADFWGGNSSGAVVVNPSAVNAITDKGSTCTGTWATAVDPTATGGGAVHGYVGAATFPLDADCIGGAANYVPGSDVLVVRYADPQMLAPGPAEVGFAPAESSTISGHAKQVFLLSVPAAAAQLFAGTPPSVTVIKAHTYVHPYGLDVYYLRPCSVLPNGGVCTAAADGGSPIPTLMRLHLQSDGTLESEPVVEGVEQLKFEYGVATDLINNVAPAYAAASAVSSWANVVSVRIALVAVSPVREMTVPHTATFTLGALAGACTYTINNGSAPTVTGCPNFTAYGDKPWQFVRTSQQFVVQLRNRLRG
jgi:type IV pilus assembly protein PilW